MNTNNFLIVWEKWKDPFGLDDTETVTDKTDDEFAETTKEITVKKMKCNILSTPLGIIPFNETISSNDVFNFWTGHTNFALTNKINTIIEDTPGVETINVFTKYRFRISIGKAFSDSSVMREINNNVYDYLYTEIDYVK